MIQLLIANHARIRAKDRFGYKPEEIVARLYRDSKNNEVKKKIKAILDCLKFEHVELKKSISDPGVSSLASQLEGKISLNPSAESEPKIDPCLAIMQSDISSLELFFKRGGDVESKNHNGLTLLNLALNKKSDFTVERVLSAGADPNQELQFGLRPLHKACQYLMLSSVRALLNAGADPTMRDKRKRLPIENLPKVRGKKSLGSKDLWQAKRDTIRMIEKVISEKIEETQLRGLQAQLDGVEINPLTAQIDIDSIQL